MLVALATPAGAVEPGEMLADPALEARAREIGRELRCLVCQNQSIDDSNAELARDLRRLVRERVALGEDKGAVIAHVVARYGNFVRLRPPMDAATYALWFGPLAVLAAGAALVWSLFRRRTRRANAERLGDSERARLKSLLDGEGQ
jgi:cytochrome c-type biogenesis protein CcmH